MGVEGVDETAESLVDGIGGARPLGVGMEVPQQFRSVNHGAKGVAKHVHALDYPIRLRWIRDAVDKVGAFVKCRFGYGRECRRRLQERNAH